MAGRGSGRRFRRVIGLGVGALLLSSCIVGATDGARMVTNTSAILDGRLGTTADGEGSYWFEYGPTTDYGRTTPRSTDVVVAGEWTQVSEEVAGLEPGATYHFRLCGRSAADQGTCGPDKTVTTGLTRGRVRGSWSSYDPGPFPPYTESRESVSLDVVGDVDGGPHLEGEVSYYSVFPGTPTSGPLTASGGPAPLCLRIEGNRATVAFEAGNYFLGIFYYLTLVIEDNGPTGDRLLISSDAPELCPDPTTASGTPSAGSGSFTVEGG